MKFKNAFLEDPKMLTLSREGVSDSDLSAALAEALGWPDIRINRHLGASSVADYAVLVLEPECRPRAFSYKDPSVMVGVAKRYGIFPDPFVDNDGNIIAWELFSIPLSTKEVSKKNQQAYAKCDTPEEVVALMAIYHSQVRKENGFPY